MIADLKIQINGQTRTLLGLSSPSDLARVVNHLALKSDRIAVEHNGQIVSRAEWAQTQVREEDRLEIVHFVGGGAITTASNTKYGY